MDLSLDRNVLSRSSTPPVLVPALAEWTCGHTWRPSKGEDDRAPLRPTAPSRSH